MKIKSLQQVQSFHNIIWKTRLLIKLKKVNVVDQKCTKTKNSSRLFDHHQKNQKVLLKILMKIQVRPKMSPKTAELEASPLKILPRNLRILNQNLNHLKKDIFIIEERDLQPITLYGINDLLLSYIWWSINKKTKKIKIIENINKCYI